MFVSVKQTVRPLLPAALALLACAAVPPLRADGIVNPSGIVLGGTAVFRVDVGPVSFPDSMLTWTGVPNGAVSFPDGPTGRCVVVRGERAGDVELRVAVAGLAGPKPVFKARVVPAATVKADAWIVGDNGIWARNEDEVRGLFDDANDVLAQVGVRLSLESIHYTNCVDWLDFDPEANNWRIPNQIADFANEHDGLVVFFVRTMTGYNGLHADNTILIKAAASFRTLGHETGHAFGLSDIYTHFRNAPTNIPPDLPPCRIFQSDDWGTDSEESFYPAGTTQSNLVERLLMFGVGDSDGDGGTDIPFGDVCGLWYDWTVDPQTGRRIKTWYLSPAPVSFFEHATLPPSSP